MFFVLIRHDQSKSSVDGCNSRVRTVQQPLSFLEPQFFWGGSEIIDKLTIKQSV